MRIERWATMSFGRVLKPDLFTPAIRRIPILMYHTVSRSSIGGANRYYQTHTSPELFGRHMEILRKENFKVITVSEAFEKLMETGTGGNFASITFDDGYLDFRDVAWPIMRDHGFCATVFLPTGFVGTTSKRFLNKRLLSWDDIAGLRSEGVEIGSHTVTHQKLGRLSKEALDRELGESKAAIEGRTGAIVKSFSCPYAFPETVRFKALYQDTLEKHGYLCAVTTMIGRATSRDGKYFLKRIPVNDYDDEGYFLGKISGAYDWMRLPQWAVKTVKSGR